MDATVVPQEPPPKTTTFGSRIAGAMAMSVLPTPEVYWQLENCSCRGDWQGKFPAIDDLEC
jgi:hypothetical protein